MRRLCVVALVLVFSLVAFAGSAHASGNMQWPVVGPVIRGFDPPDSPYSSGHRGIDIAAPLGTPVIAPAEGVVAFAGPVGGSLYVSIDHADGLRSTFSWLSSREVEKGDVVREGQLIGHSGLGHSGSVTPHLHLGMRIADVYVNPLDYLTAPDLTLLLRLVQLPSASSA
jgi:murein DD-endopeptidase MepM/ murein hydrolase activator NlpD